MKWKIEAKRKNGTNAAPTFWVEANSKEEAVHTATAVLDSVPEDDGSFNYPRIVPTIHATVDPV